MWDMQQKPLTLLLKEINDELPKGVDGTALTKLGLQAELNDNQILAAYLYSLVTHPIAISRLAILRRQYPGILPQPPRHPDAPTKTSSLQSVQAPLSAPRLAMTATQETKKNFTKQDAIDCSKGLDNKEIFFLKELAAIPYRITMNDFANSIGWENINKVKKYFQRIKQHGLIDKWPLITDFGREVHKQLDPQSGLFFKRFVSADGQNDPLGSHAAPQPKRKKVDSTPCFHRLGVENGVNSLGQTDKVLLLNLQSLDVNTSGIHSQEQAANKFNIPKDDLVKAVKRLKSRGMLSTWSELTNYGQAVADMLNQPPETSLATVLEAPAPAYLPMQQSQIERTTTQQQPEAPTSTIAQSATSTTTMSDLKRMRVSTLLN